MRTPQEIFNYIIHQTNFYNSSNRFMCIALDSALREGDITLDEWKMCTKEIIDYLGNEIDTLTCIVEDRVIQLTGKSWCEKADRFERFEHCRTVYENWNNREDFIVPKQFQK